MNVSNRCIRYVFDCIVIIMHYSRFAFTEIGITVVAYFNWLNSIGYFFLNFPLPFRYYKLQSSNLVWFSFLFHLKNSFNGILFTQNKFEFGFKMNVFLSRLNYSMLMPMAGHFCMGLVLADGNYLMRVCDRCVVDT